MCKIRLECPLLEELIEKIAKKIVTEETGELRREIPRVTGNLLGGGSNVKSFRQKQAERIAREKKFEEKAREEEKRQKGKKEVMQKRIKMCGCEKRCIFK